MRTNVPIEVAAAAVKTVAVGGPLAVATTAIGGILILVTSTAAMEDHARELVVLCAVVLIVLGFVEWALASRISRHEVVEKRDRSELLKQVLEDSKAHVERISGEARAHMERVEYAAAASSGGFSAINTKLDQLNVDLSRLGNEFVTIREDLSRVGVDIKELKDWRQRIGNRLGELR